MYLYIYIYIHTLSHLPPASPLKILKLQRKFYKSKTYFGVFRVFTVFNLASSLITFKLQGVNLTPKRNFWCLDSCALCFCFLFVAILFALLQLYLLPFPFNRSEPPIRRTGRPFKPPLTAIKLPLHLPLPTPDPLPDPPNFSLLFASFSYFC